MAYINSSRRKQRFVFSNGQEIYDDILTRKRIRAIRQFSTLTLQPLIANSENKIQEVFHIWKTGDRYFKLANQYYGKPELWWIIALYNKMRTEGHLAKGDLVKIPVPIELVLYYV